MVLPRAFGWDQDLEQTIRSIMSQRHPTPQTIQRAWSEVRAPAEQVVSTAIAMFQRSSSGMEKSRLIEVIAHFDTPEAVEFVRESATQSDQSSIVRQIALRSLGTQLSRQEDGKSLEVLETALQSENSQLKTSAAMGLERAMANTSLQHRVSPMLEAYRSSNATSPFSTKNPSKDANSKLNLVRTPALVGSWDGVGLTFVANRPAQTRKATFVLEADGSAKLVGSGNEASVTFENAKWDSTQGFSWTGRWKTPCMARLRETTPPLLECVCPQSGFVFLGRK